MDWGKVEIGSPLKAADNWARQTREKSAGSLSERGNSLVDKVPVGRFGKAEEVAYAVLFLASDEASNIQAAEIVIAGGATGAPSGAPIYRQ